MKLAKPNKPLFNLTKPHCKERAISPGHPSLLKIAKLNKSPSNPAKPHCKEKPISHGRPSLLKLAKPNTKLHQATIHSLFNPTHNNAHMVYKEQTISSCLPTLLKPTPHTTKMVYEEQHLSHCNPSFITTTALSTTQTVEQLVLICLMCEVTRKPAVNAMKFIALYVVTEEISRAALPQYIISLTDSTAFGQVTTTAARENSRKI